MPNLLLFFTGNRNPSITEILTTGSGTVYSLASSTARFKMRAVGSSTLIVDQPVSNTLAADGVVRYDWSAADITAITADVAALNSKEYLIWWEVTTSGKTQDMAEALIEWRSHSNAQIYIELEQAKADFELTGFTFADHTVMSAVRTASRAIDDACGRRFYPDTDANQVRYYSPHTEMQLRIDDLITLTTLKTDWDGDGVFETTWVLNTDFHLEPFNPELIDGTNREPWEKLTVRPPLVGATFGAIRFPVWFPRSVQVTGKFGWPVTPEPVKTATTILIARLVKRIREAPLGMIPGGLDQAAMRIARTDPDIQGLLHRYVRTGVPFR